MKKIKLMMMTLMMSLVFISCKKEPIQPNVTNNPDIVNDTILVTDTIADTLYTISINYTGLSNSCGMSCYSSSSISTNLSTVVATFHESNSSNGYIRHLKLNHLDTLNLQYSFNISCNENTYTPIYAQIKVAVKYLKIITKIMVGETEIGSTESWGGYTELDTRTDTYTVWTDAGHNMVGTNNYQFINN